MSGKFDICFDVRMVHASGIGTYVKTLLPDVARHFRVALLGRTREEIKRAFPALEATVIPFDAKPYSLKEQALFPKVVPPCRLFWSPHFNAPLLPIQAKLRLLTLHDVYHLAFSHTFPLWKAQMGRALIKNAVYRADRVLTVSHFSNSEIERYLGIRNFPLEVIHNGIDLQKFQRQLTTSMTQEMRAKYRLPKRFVLALGNVKPHKNLKRLLLALKLFCERCKSPLHLVIVGQRRGMMTQDGELERMIQGDPFFEEHVIFTDRVPDEDLPVLYRLALFLAFPSLYEGFGLPPLEAMACGCPVLVAKAASLPEVCGEAVEYIDPYCVESISQGIERMVLQEPLRLRLKERGLKHVADFSLEKMVEAHIQVLRELLV